MTRRNAILDGHPLGFEQRGFGKAHENRVERAGLKFRFAAQFIPVAPGGWVFDEAFENAESLRGYSRNLHRNSLHICRHPSTARCCGAKVMSIHWP